MSDDRLRELERAWREAGTVESEAALLWERRRTGGLATVSLELAALLGHTAAAMAMGMPVAMPPTESELNAFTLGHANNQTVEPPAWISKVHALGGDEALRRLASGAQRRNPHIPPDALDAVERWIREPSAARRQECRPHLAADGALTREVAKLVVTWGGHEVCGFDVIVATCRTLFLCFRTDADRQAAILAGASEVSDWALGYRDALAERVDRQEA